MSSSPSEWREVSAAELAAWREAAFDKDVGLRGKSLELDLPRNSTSASAVQSLLSSMRQSASCNDLTGHLKPAPDTCYTPPLATPPLCTAGVGDRLSLDSVGTVPTAVPPQPHKPTAKKKHRRLASLQGLLAALVGDKHLKREPAD